MKVEIKVPAMGESISQATIGMLLKPSGSFVAADDELIELETDKVNQVLYAPQGGVVTWGVSPDDVVKIGQVLGSIDTEQKGAAATVSKGVETAKASVSKQVPQVEAKAAPSKETKKEAPDAAEEQASAKSVTPQPASKAKSSGYTGARATKELLISELSHPAPGASHANSGMGAVGERETRKKMSKIRKVIATRLVDALQQTAMLTTFNEVDMSNIMALRDTYKEGFNKKYQARLGFMSFFIKAAVDALKEFPEVNSYIDGDEIVYRNYFDISIAVGTDRGLVVPVVRDCDYLSFAEIEQAIEAYAKKAREGGLTADDLQGGGFTITNGGVYGSLLSTPILNLPQCAILGMHKIMKRAVVVDDQIVIRPMMNLALSYDHRVIDGKEAVSFLVHIKNCLEDPSRLLLGV